MLSSRAESKACPERSRMGTCVLYSALLLNGWETTNPQFAGLVSGHEFTRANTHPHLLEKQPTRRAACLPINHKIGCPIFGALFAPKVGNHNTHPAHIPRSRREHTKIAPDEIRGTVPINIPAVPEGRHDQGGSRSLPAPEPPLFIENRSTRRRRVPIQIYPRNLND